MNRILIIAITILSLSSCVTLKPKDFTYQYTDKCTGLDSIINIDGYYITQRECDSTFYSIFIFHPKGLFTIATGTNLSEIIKCFENADEQSLVCKYPSWGVYRIEKNRIRTQTIRQEGIGFCTIFRDYEILPDKTIVNINDYVIPANTNIGYMEKYPSFNENPCKQPAKFYPLQEKPEYETCPYLKKKWFNKN